MTAVSVKLVPPIHTEHMESLAVMPRKPNVTTVEKNPGSRLGYICGHQAGDIMQSRYCAGANWWPRYSGRISL